MSREAVASEPAVESHLALARARVIDATVRVVGECGYAHTSVTHLTAAASISTGAFHEVFDSPEDCLLAVLELGTRHVGELISRALAGEGAWLDRVRTALTEVLAFLDSEPLWARVMLVEATAAGPRARALCERKVVEITEMIEHCWAREVERGERRARARLGERQSRRTWPTVADVAGLDWLADPRSHRARACVVYLAAHPGASNRQIAEGIGVARHSQMSSLLARLAGTGLLLKRPGRPGRPNAWSLTERGVQVTLALRRWP
jgi:AcrR family transcriptional regulator